MALSCYFCYLTNSVNGLVVAFCEIKGYFYPYLLNPTTRDFIGLPKSNLEAVSEAWSSLGLGFIDSTGEYKLVRFYYNEVGNYEHCACEVLTLGTQAWRFFGNVPYGFLESLARPPVFVNGVIYWLASEYDYHTIVRGILTFDIKDEKFGFISISQITKCLDYPSILTLEKLEGHIFLVQQIVNLREKFVRRRRTWMLRDYTNNEWEAKYNIDMYDDNPYRQSRVIDIKDGMILMINREFGNVIYSYDLNRRTSDMLHPKASSMYLNIIEGSLIPPTSLFPN